MTGRSSPRDANQELELADHFVTFAAEWMRKIGLSRAQGTPGDVYLEFRDGSACYLHGGAAGVVPQAAPPANERNTMQQDRPAIGLG